MTAWPFGAVQALAVISRPPSAGTQGASQYCGPYAVVSGSQIAPAGMTILWGLTFAVRLPQGLVRSTETTVSPEPFEPLEVLPGPLFEIENSGETAFSGIAFS